MDTTILSPTAETLVAVLAPELRDLLGRLSDTRMYPTPEKVAEIVDMSAGWMTNEANTTRPFIPAEGVREAAQQVIADYLPGFVEPYVGSYPADTLFEVTQAGARDVAGLLDAAGLLIPSLPEDEQALALKEAVTYVRGRTQKRNGVMGGGYYSAYVSDEDIAAALFAAGWRKQD